MGSVFRRGLRIWGNFRSGNCFLFLNLRFGIRVIIERFFLFRFEGDYVVLSVGIGESFDFKFEFRK